MILTQTGVDEAVPNTSSSSDQPPPLGAGREAERRAQHADQQVAHRDARQQQVHGRAQSPVPAEQRQHQEVTEKAQSADAAQAHRHHQVPGRTQRGGGQRVRDPSARIRRFFSGTSRAAQAPVGNDHTEVWTSWNFGPIRARCAKAQSAHQETGWRTAASPAVVCAHRCAICGGIFKPVPFV